VDQQESLRLVVPILVVEELDELKQPGTARATESDRFYADFGSRTATGYTPGRYLETVR
jgi:hypothetical protein